MPGVAVTNSVRRPEETRRARDLAKSRLAADDDASAAPKRHWPITDNCHKTHFYYFALPRQFLAVTRWRWRWWPHSGPFVCACYPLSDMFPTNGWRAGRNIEKAIASFALARAVDDAEASSRAGRGAMPEIGGDNERRALRRDGCPSRSGNGVSCPAKNGQARTTRSLEGDRRQADRVSQPAIASISRDSSGRLRLVSITATNTMRRRVGNASQHLFRIRPLALLP